MSDWLQIDRPILPPASCILCGGGIGGPVIDTRRDIPLLPDGGRVYACRTCMKLGAVLFGFAPGEALDELHEAGALLEAVQAQIEEHRELHAQSEAAIAELLASLKERDEELELAHGSVAQLQAALNRVREDTMAQLEAVAPVHGSPMESGSPMEKDDYPTEEDA